MQCKKDNSCYDCTNYTIIKGLDKCDDTIKYETRICDKTTQEIEEYKTMHTDSTSQIINGTEIKIIKKSQCKITDQ